jgi:hypothetical protein
MGYLDNSTITVDAILTKKGREYLAQGRNAFNITQFALADDEVDYDLWNPAHPLGSDYYGVVIENMPITEAVPDETQSMKYKLLTLPRGTTAIPFLQADKSTVSVTDAQTGNVRVETFYYSGIANQNGMQNLLNALEGYTVTLLDSTYVSMLTLTKGATVIQSGGGISAAASQTARVVPNTSSPNSNAIEIILVHQPGVESLQADVIKSTKLIITGNETGGRVVIPVTIQNV